MHPTSPPPPPRRSRRKRTLLVVVIAAVAVAASVTVFLLVRDSPAKAVERYLTAVLDRDPAAALAEVAPDSLPADGKDVFLTAEAMRTDWEFHDIETGSETYGGGRNVNVEFTGFGRIDWATFTTEKTDDGWKVASPFAQVAFERSSLDYLDVDGVRLTDPAPQILDPRPVYPVFPGTHRFFESLPDDLEATDPEAFDRLLVPSEQEPTPSPVPELTVGGDLLEEAQEQIRGIIDDCAASEAAMPQREDVPDDMRFCPFGLQISYESEAESTYLDHEGVTWEVLEYPEFSLADPPGLSGEHAQGFRGIEAVVELEGSIRVTATGTRYGTDGRYGTDVEAVFECAFAPGGFRGTVDQSEAIAMYYFTTDPDNAGPIVEFDKEDCTDTVEES